MTLEFKLDQAVQDWSGDEESHYGVQHGDVPSSVASIQDIQVDEVPRIWSFA